MGKIKSLLLHEICLIGACALTCFPFYGIIFRSEGDFEVGSKQMSDGYLALAAGREECRSHSLCTCPISQSELPGQSLTSSMS